MLGASTQWAMRLGTCVGALVIAAAACGDASPTSADAAEPASPPPGFGERCTPAVGCAAGLDCMQSEYSPFPWCTHSCPAESVGDVCDHTQLGGRTAYCVQMPAGWVGPPEPFCAPRCDNKAACKSLAADWEVCSEVEYKKVPLYPGTHPHVCQAPSAHGQEVIDPVTCDWKTKITDPTVTGAKNTCDAYCTFLTTCKLFDLTLQPVDCCTWQCFQRITPGGNVDAAKEAQTKCFVKAFLAFQATPQVCTGYLEQCGPVP